MSEATIWVCVIGAMCAMSCALVGNFLLLRKMSMMGDAISHAVLPGLAIAFLVTGTRASLTMFFGAAVVGVLTAVFTQWIHSFGRVDRGAAMGVVFTTLFAIGLILIVRAADHVDLDPGCVLYGSIDITPYDTVAIGSHAIPRAALIVGSVLLLNAIVVALFYKELKISSFDPALATTLGINATFMHYLLMTLTAITTVACFESIGSILVIAMLIVPAAAAHLLTDRLSAMIGVSLLFGAIVAPLGRLAATTVPPLFGYEDTTSAGAMATVAGFGFIGVMLLAPRHGVVSKLVARARLATRITHEDVLGLMYRMDERDSLVAPDRAPELIAELTTHSESTARRTIKRLTDAGLLRFTGGAIALTELGRKRAQSLVRTHRLWEAYLEKHMALPPDHLDAPAHLLEHLTDAELRAQLAAETDRPTTDPHGKPIPPGSGDTI